MAVGRADGDCLTGAGNGLHKSRLLRDGVVMDLIMTGLRGAGHCGWAAGDAEIANEMAVMSCRTNIGRRARASTDGCCALGSGDPRGKYQSPVGLNQWRTRLPVRPRARRGRSGLASVPAPVRHRAHLRMLKRTLGWTTPKLRSPEAADRWTWLLLAAYTQLCLARDLTTDLRRPWEKPRPAQRLSPVRIRRGFRNLRPPLACPARVPKPSRRGPGRSAGLPNHRPASRHDVHTVSSSNTQKPKPCRKTKSSNPRPRRTG